ncbi:hypothetical protein N9893_02080 [bacterium]|nr:hypothetical protein [bacterium]
MSTSTQNELISSVQKNYEHFASCLRLKKPSFATRGYLSSAKMTATGGTVEILCGPPEYHAEIFIECAATNKRWGLADLIQVESIKHWLDAYQSKTESQSNVEADVEWIFYILSEGLKGIKEFAWIQR